MRDSLYLAWQYLRHHPLTTGVLVACITLIAFLPVALQTVVSQAEAHLRSRGESTPLLIGSRGSELELVLSVIYFEKPWEPVLRHSQWRQINEQALGDAIPLHVRFATRDAPIVGTTSEYLKVRKLRLAQGKPFDLLGECVLGAAVAKRLQLRIGDRLPAASGPAFVLDSPPLRLRVSGILEATETPDDEAVLVAVETTWIMEGLGHGHAPQSQHGSGAALYTDITAENVASFHFHGSRDTFPLSAVLVYPQSAKAETLLRGQYLSPEATAQCLRPSEVMNSLINRILMVRSYLAAAIGLVISVTLLAAGMVLWLSIRMRQAELVTMIKIGCSPRRIATILGLQVVLILLAGLVLAAGLTLAARQAGPAVIRLFVA